MSVINMLPSGGGTTLAKKASGGASSEGNYTVRYTCPRAGLYMLIVAGAATNTRTINTPSITDGSVLASETVLDNTRDEAEALTKAFVIRANSANAEITCSTRFSGYMTNKYMVFALE